MQHSANFATVAGIFSVRPAGSRSNANRFGKIAFPVGSTAFESLARGTDQFRASDINSFSDDSILI